VPYVKNSLLKDPWGKEYLFRSPGDHGEFDIFSYGADGQSGGEGKNADITSWE
jgi:general secretion pathway protein G